MKLGIISDTHDNVPKVKAAVELFNTEGVEAVVHCGDFIAPFAILPYKDLACGKFFGVFGNNDGEKKGLGQIAQTNNWQIEPGPFKLAIGGKKITLIHEPDLLEELISKGESDIIAYGHLHRPKIEDENGTLVINPGEGGGWTSSNATLAIIDLKTMQTDILTLT